MNTQSLVLYAEDDENDAFFMQRVFDQLKRTEALRIVTDGNAVINYLSGAGEFGDREKFPLPTMLLLDVKMPLISGLETLQWVRASPQFRRLPVVMFTSSTQSSDVAYSRDHGANAFFVKPSNAQHLAILMADLLSVAERTKASTAAPFPVAGNQVASGI